MYKRQLYGDGVYCPTDTEAMCEKLLAGDSRALEYCGNALYAPAVELQPDIERNAALLRDRAIVNMTGSGGTVLGYFTDIEKFYRCATELRGERGFRAFATAKTGVLHEWIEK